MRFTVPQFIEHEAKIVGPLTFKQFLFIGLATAICFILYFSVPFSVFLLAAILMMFGAGVLAFLKIGGRTISAILTNILKFSFTPKMYIWKRKEMAIMVYKKESKFVSPKTEDEAAKEELPLKIAGKSQLKKLSVQMETNTK